MPGRWRLREHRRSMAGLMVGYLYWHCAWYWAHSRSVSARDGTVKTRTQRERMKEIVVNRRAMMDAGRGLYQ